MMRIVLLFFAAMTMLWTAQANAATCGEVINAANDANESWWEPDGSASLVYVDGSAIKTPIQLSETLRLVVGEPRNAEDMVPIIVGGEFGGWDFSAIDSSLGATCFYKANMQGSQWDGGKYPGIGFIDSNLDGASFADAKIDHVLLRNNQLVKTNMKGASLVGGSMDGGWDSSVENLDVSGADMRNFAFKCGITISDGCALSRDGFIMAGANLKGADISTFYFDASAVAGAIIDRTTVSPGQIADLKLADVSGPVVLNGGDYQLSLSTEEFVTVAAAVIDFDAPSFDCTLAASAVEKMICGEGGNHLRSLDRQMAELYGMARAKDKSVPAMQKQWLAKRTMCKDEDCLTKAYENRVAVLISIAGQPPVPQGTTDALYIDEVVRFNDAFRTKPLFARLKPVLIGASMSKAIVTRSDDGSYAATGSAIGANAHSCSLAADGMRLDTKSGWYGVRNKGKFIAILQFVGDEMDFAWGYMPWSEDSGLDQYISCGMRARFGPMRRIDVDAETMEREMQALATEY